MYCNGYIFAFTMVLDRQHIECEPSRILSQKVLQYLYK